MQSPAGLVALSPIFRGGSALLGLEVSTRAGRGRSSPQFFQGVDRASPLLVFIESQRG
jgi:hypothetical protein